MARTMMGGIPVHGYGERQPTSLAQALGAGQEIFKTINTFQNDATTRQGNLANMAKVQAETRIKQNQLNAMGGLSGAYDRMLNPPQMQPIETLPAPSGIPVDPNYQIPMEMSPETMSVADAASIFHQAGGTGGGFKSALEGINQNMQNESLSSAMDYYNAQPESLTRAAIMADIGGGKAVPKTVDIKGDTMFNPYDMGAKTRVVTGADGRPVVNKKVFDMEQTMGKNFRNLSDPFRKRTASYSRLKSLYDSDQSVSDVGMIFDLMKMFDPTSTVREGEYATVANSGGIDAEWTSLYNRFLKGGRLPAGVRDNIMNTAQGVYESSKKEYDFNVADLQRLAEMYPGLQWERIDTPVMEIDTSPPPRITVQDQALLESAKRNAEGIIMFDSSTEGRYLNSVMPSGTKYIFINEAGEEIRGAKP